MHTDASIDGRADFSEIRYAQCWEDADILLEGLDIQPGDTCLSIASAGDNTLAMLAKDPGRVIALDLSPAQLFCLELRVAAYRALEYPEWLELIGSRPSARRLELYRRCRKALSPRAVSFWDAREAGIQRGIGAIGKFERYFTLFREGVLPLIHSQETIEELMRGGDLPTRERFYRKWNNRRWRVLFHLFFSRVAMGWLGRDPEFFRYVEGSVAERILDRTRHALIQLDPAENPYMQWILTGEHPQALPFALREENFEKIRQNLGKLEWHCLGINEFLDREGGAFLDRSNLSDIFEYMSPASYRQLLERLVGASRKGGRLAYWNMLAPRHRPEEMQDRLESLTELSERLFREDKAFFYSAFVVEEIR